MNKKYGWRGRPRSFQYGEVLNSIKARIHRAQRRLQRKILNSQGIVCIPAGYDQPQILFIILYFDTYVIDSNNN